MFVHNWEGNATDPTTGIAGIKFIPGNNNAQAISTLRNDNEIVLMNTGNGRFSIPGSLHIISISKGYVNSRDVWVGEVKITPELNVILVQPGDNTFGGNKVNYWAC